MMFSQIKKAAIIRGLVLGVVILALDIFTFYFMTSMTKSPLSIMVGQFIFSIILPLVAAILLVLNLKKQIVGFWEFRKAASDIFVVFLTAVIFSSIGRDLIFAKVVEPQMAQKLNQSMVSATKLMLEKSKATPAQIDSKLQEIQRNFADQVNASAGRIIQGIIITIIFLFIFALVFAVVFKREPPLTPSNADPTV